VSTGLLARRERLPALTQVKRFDVALVDEAHAARRRNPSGGPGANPDFGRLWGGPDTEPMPSFLLHRQQESA